MASGLENKCLAKSLPELYLKSDLADVYFAFVTDGEIIKVPAHKIVLAIASQVFRAMFYGPLKENEVVEIVDVDDSAFKEFLQFFYLPKVTLTMKNIEAVVRLVDKYDMMECLELCEEFLESELTNENMIWGLQLAVSMNNEKLKEFCESKIQLLSSEYFKSAFFLECDREVVKNILQLDALNCSEVKLFEACIAWAKASCEANGLDENDAENLKSQLGDFLHLIRFRAMKNEEIWEILLNQMYESLFSKREMVDIFRLKSEEDFQSKLFENARRSSLKWDSSKVLTCIRGRCSPHKFFIKSQESTWFSTNVPLTLGKISIPCVRNSSGQFVDMNFTMNIIEYEERTFGTSGANKVLFTGTMQYVPSSNIGGSIPLSRPILINPKKLYEVRSEAAQTSTEIHHCWIWNSEVKLNDTIVVKFHESPSDTNQQSGFVSVLSFNQYPK